MVNNFRELLKDDESTIKVDLSELGFGVGAKALGLIKRRKRLEREEVLWLERVFFKVISRALYLKSRSKSANNRFSGINGVSEDDIYGEVSVCFFSVSIKRVKEVENFNNWFFISAFYHVRDKAAHYELGGKSVPRTRRSDSEEVRNRKNAARYGNSLIVDTDTQEEAGEQNAIELEAQQVGATFGKDIFMKIHEDVEVKELVNLLATSYPIIFSRMFLNLSSDEVFIGAPERIERGNGEMDSLIMNDIIDERNLSKGDVKWLLRRWISSSKSAGKTSDINWKNASLDIDKKTEFLVELGLYQENAEMYLGWLKANQANYIAGEEVVAAISARTLN